MTEFTEAYSPAELLVSVSGRPDSVATEQCEIKTHTFYRLSSARTQREGSTSHNLALTLHPDVWPLRGTHGVFGTAFAQSERIGQPNRCDSVLAAVLMVRCHAIQAIDGLELSI
mgnify:FL=1